MRGKVVLVGDSCGKTSLVWRAVHKEEELGTFVPTVLLEQEVRLYQSRLRPLSYVGCDLFIFLCAVHRKKTLLNIRFKWNIEVDHYCPRSKKVLVISSCDLDNKEITDEDLEAARKDLRMEAVYRVSAKTGEGVQEMFLDIGRLIKETYNRPTKCSIS